jgi:hypothetical protein
VHVAENRMIAQRMDGSYLKGVIASNGMLSYIDLAKSALEHQPGHVEYVKLWAKSSLGRLSSLGRVKLLDSEDWFHKGHGIMGGTKDANGVWIPDHTPEGKAYL